jgi:hypothetical protein
MEKVLRVQSRKSSLRLLPLLPAILNAIQCYPYSNQCRSRSGFRRSTIPSGFSS